MKILGIATIALGWVVLLFFSGVSIDGFPGVREVANLHTMNIGIGLIITGGFLFLGGVSQEAISRLSSTKEPEPISPNSPQKKTSTTIDTTKSKEEIQQSIEELRSRLRNT